jgi:hypothetical protein
MVLCRVEALRLPHAVAVLEMSRWLTVQCAGISTRGARGPVVVIILIHVWVLLSHAEALAVWEGLKGERSSRGASSVCKEPAVARCESCSELHEARAAGADGKGVRPILRKGGLGVRTQLCAAVWVERVWRVLDGE